MQFPPTKIITCTANKTELDQIHAHWLESTQRLQTTAKPDHTIRILIMIFVFYVHLPGNALFHVLHTCEEEKHLDPVTGSDHSKIKSIVYFSQGLLHP